MAKNTGSNYRQGAVKGISQTYNPQSGTYIKRNSETGKLMDVKSNGTPFKGVTKEK